VQTFVERDLPQLGINVPAQAMLRFWTMVAHCHGNIWNSAEPARSLGISEPTVRRYLDTLAGLFMVRQLQPWHENLGKRQVRSPKVYLIDPSQKILAGVTPWFVARPERVSEHRRAQTGQR
jgi:predicted AAA+ superfamily ATPase